MDYRDSRLINIVKSHEGFRPSMYLDSEGVPTIGYGTNLRTLVITEKEAEDLMLKELRKLWSLLNVDPVFSRLSEPRKIVLMDMAYNLGYVGLRQFKNMWAALKEGNYEKAAEEMLDSKWARQVGRRATELAEIMRINVLPDSYYT
ncbi:MAG: hypothetical protein D6746_15005 [Bacteroidetes bacterium]|nr:MAG: hypothetical protein D6746_15005 [Bacteroidota bacterium]